MYKEQVRWREELPLISFLKSTKCSHLPERYPSKLQESVCIVHIERKYIRQEENTTCINFISPPNILN